MVSSQSSTPIKIRVRDWWESLSDGEQSEVGELVVGFLEADGEESMDNRPGRPEKTVQDHLDKARQKANDLDLFVDQFNGGNRAKTVGLVLLYLIAEGRLASEADILFELEHAKYEGLHLELLPNNPHHFTDYLLTLRHHKPLSIQAYRKVLDYGLDNYPTSKRYFLSVYGDTMFQWARRFEAQNLHEAAKRCAQEGSRVLVVWKETGLPLDGTYRNLESQFLEWQGQFLAALTALNEVITAARSDPTSSTRYLQELRGRQRRLKQKADLISMNSGGRIDTLLLQVDQSLADGDTSRAMSLAEEALRKAIAVKSMSGIGISYAYIGLCLAWKGDAKGAGKSFDMAKFNARRDARIKEVEERAKSVKRSLS